MDENFDTRLQSSLEDVQRYADELRAEAQGDFDFITKFLDRQHKLALGTNDAQRAEFFESVANSLEERIGRIPFDFQQRSEREKQDLSDFLRKQEIESQDLLERESQFARQQELETQREQKQISEQANVRGVLGSGIEERQQQEASQTRQLQQEDRRRQFALERLLREFETGRGQLESGRRIEDITTAARRGAQDLELETEQRRESAQRELDQRLSGIDRERSAEERRVRSLQQAIEEFNIFNQPSGL